MVLDLYLKFWTSDGIRIWIRPDEPEFDDLYCRTSTSKIQEIGAAQEGIHILMILSVGREFTYTRKLAKQLVVAC